MLERNKVAIRTAERDALRSECARLRADLAECVAALRALLVAGDCRLLPADMRQGAFEAEQTARAQLARLGKEGV